MIATNRIKPRKGKTNEYGEKSELDMGGQVADALPHELGLLARKDTRVMALRKIAERTLDQWKREDESSEAEGPIIFCCDKSGSMNHQRMTYVKALLLTLASEARAQRRDFAVIWFDWEVDQMFRFDRRSTPADILESLNVHAGGGTDFDYPLNKAVQLLEDEKPFSRADIIFLTDGEASAPTDWLQKKREKIEFNLTGIGLECGEESLHFCDTVIEIATLSPECTQRALESVRK
jgi:uncharacterized protein with von Willebrand factor type A (vWA) domain